MDNSENSSQEITENSRLTKDYTEATPFELYAQSYGELNSAPIDLWILYLIKFCYYGSVSTLLASISVLLTEVHDKSDWSSLSVLALIAVVSILATIVSAHFPDKFGLKLSLTLAGIISCFQYSWLIIFENFYAQVFGIVVIGSASYGLQVAALDIGMKFYTNPKFRTLAISIGISVNNAALIIGGIVIEITYALGDQTHTTFKVIFYFCLALSAIGTVLSMFLRNLDFEHRQEVEVEKRYYMESAFQHTRLVVILKSFWRFFAISLMLLIIKIVFYQQSVVMPKYMTREMGDDAFYQVIIIINQVVTIILLPICSYSIYFYNPYDIFLSAGTLAVMSPIVFVLGAGYLTIFIHMIIASISESFLAPRIVSYALLIAPNGKESVFLALTSIPYMFSMFLTGITGWPLLETFCPEDGERDCWAMWLIISAYTAPAVLVLFFCRKWLEEPVFENNPFIPCSDESKS